MSDLKKDLLSLKSRLEKIESSLAKQTKDLQLREDKWKNMELKAVQFRAQTVDFVTLNIGGSIFQTLKSTLFSVKDTLFCKMIESHNIDFSEEVFFDRSPKLFPYILNFIRTGKINYQRFNKEELAELKIEVDYYQIEEIQTYIEDLTREIEFLNFETSGDYKYNNKVAGTQILADLKDKDLKSGICSNSPGKIQVELNREWEFDEIEIGGWNGDSYLWYNGNGSGAKIYTSKDKETWTQVGTIPSTYASKIVSVKITKSVAKHIKFEHSSYLGIGYLFVHRVKIE